MNLFLFLKRIFVKPKSMGECLGRVKKAFNAVGEDIAHKPGVRIYKTPRGNVVNMENMYGDLSITKNLNNCYATEEYIGLMEGLDRCRSVRLRPGDNNVHWTKETIYHKFAKAGDKGVYTTYPEISSRYYDRIANELGYDAINRGARPVKNIIKTDKKMAMPYERAVASGLIKV